jgi:hypothetical protein
MQARFDRQKSTLWCVFLTIVSIVTMLAHSVIHFIVTFLYDDCLAASDAMRLNESNFSQIYNRG